MLFGAVAGLAQHFAAGFAFQHLLQVQGFDELLVNAALGLFAQARFAARQRGLELGAQAFALLGHALDAALQLVALEIGRGNGDHRAEGRQGHEQRDHGFDLEERGDQLQHVLFFFSLCSRIRFRS